MKFGKGAYRGGPRWGGGSRNWKPTARDEDGNAVHITDYSRLLEGLEQLCGVVGTLSANMATVKGDLLGNVGAAVAEMFRVREYVSPRGDLGKKLTSIERRLGNVEETLYLLSAVCGGGRPESLESRLERLEAAIKDLPAAGVRGMTEAVGERLLPLDVSREAPRAVPLVPESARPSPGVGVRGGGVRPCSRRFLQPFSSSSCVAPPPPGFVSYSVGLSPSAPASSTFDWPPSSRSSAPRVPLLHSNSGGSCLRPMGSSVSQFQPTWPAPVVCEGAGQQFVPGISDVFHEVSVLPPWVPSTSSRGALCRTPSGASAAPGGVLVPRAYGSASSVGMEMECLLMSSEGVGATGGGGGGLECRGSCSAFLDEEGEAGDGSLLGAAAPPVPAVGPLFTCLWPLDCVG